MSAIFGELLNFQQGKVSRIPASIGWSRPLWATDLNIDVSVSGFRVRDTCGGYEETKNYRTAV